MNGLYANRLFDVNNGRNTNTAAGLIRLNEKKISHTEVPRQVR
jgi:hypothetical protein